MPWILVFGLLWADDVRREWARFEGVWERVAHEADGRKTPAESAKRFRLVLRADGSYTVQVDKQVVVEGTARLDPTQKPKTIDMTPTTGTTKGKTLLGIYELDGDDYRICYAPSGKDRPREFSTKAGSGHVLITYRRVKK